MLKQQSTTSVYALHTTRKQNIIWREKIHQKYVFCSSLYSVSIHLHTNTWTQGHIHNRWPDTHACAFTLCVLSPSSKIPGVFQLFSALPLTRWTAQWYVSCYNRSVRSHVFISGVQDYRAVLMRIPGLNTSACWAIQYSFKALVESFCCQCE